MSLKRNTLTGFRSDWQHPKTAIPSTFDVNSDTEPAQVDRFDYAADDSEDDTKEATSMSIRKPTKANKPSKVCQPNSILTNSNRWCRISSPTLKSSSGSQRSSLHPTSEKLALPSVILICQREPSNTGKRSTFQHGTSFSALSKIHGHSVICSQKHSVSGMRCFLTTPRRLLEQENQSSTW
jgi:hypothetical protein